MIPINRILRQTYFAEIENYKETLDAVNFCLNLPRSPSILYIQCLVVKPLRLMIYIEWFEALSHCLLARS